MDAGLHPAKRPTAEQQRRGVRKGRAILAAGVAALSLAAVALLSALAAWALWGDALVQRADVVIHRQERLHFAVHLAAGRTLSLCPCTRDRAGWEYAKAARHAPTSRERALVTTQRPDRLLDAPVDGARLLAYAGWLAVHDRACRIVLLLTLLSLGIVLALVTVLSVRVYRLLPTAARHGLPEVTDGMAG